MDLLLQIWLFWISGEGHWRARAVIGRVIIRVRRPEKMPAMPQNSILIRYMHGNNTTANFAIRHDDA